MDYPEPAQSISSQAKAASTSPSRAFLMLPAHSINQNPPCRSRSGATFFEDQA
jgi:hypothetical protein